MDASPLASKAASTLGGSIRAKAAMPRAGPFASKESGSRADREAPMKMQLRVVKNGSSIYTGAYDIADAESFGKACEDAWCKMQEQQWQAETSIGALMEHLNSGVLDQLNGAHITLDRA
jgi:hypothetical protein